MIVLLGYQLVYTDWNLHVKYLVVLAGTFLITWAIYALAIRPWNILRVLFGLKWVSSRRSSSAGTAQPAEPSLAIRAGLPLLLLALLTSCAPHGGELVSRTLTAPSLSTNLLGVADRQPMAIYLPPS